MCSSPQSLCALMFCLPGLQLLLDAGAAYSIFMTAGFLALGPDFFGRVPLVFLLDFVSIYFTFGVLFDIVTLTTVLITTARLGTAPLAFYDGESSWAVLHGVFRAGVSTTCCTTLQQTCLDATANAQPDAAACVITLDTMLSMTPAYTSRSAILNICVSKACTLLCLSGSQQVPAVACCSCEGHCSVTGQQPSRGSQNSGEGQSRCVIDQGGSGPGCHCQHVGCHSSWQTPGSGRGWQSHQEYGHPHQPLCVPDIVQVGHKQLRGVAIA